MHITIDILWDIRELECNTHSTFLIGFFTACKQYKKQTATIFVSIFICFFEQ